MGVILGKSRGVIPKNNKEIRYITNTQQKAIALAKGIAADFGQQSKKQKPKKIIFR